MTKPTKKQRLLFAVFTEQLYIWRNTNDLNDSIHNQCNIAIGKSLSVDKGNLELSIRPEEASRVSNILDEMLQLAKDIEKN